MLMKRHDITRYPTIIDNVHESVYSRSYWILLLVQDLLEMNTPQKVILYILSDLTSEVSERTTWAALLEASRKEEDEIGKLIGEINDDDPTTD